MPNRDIIVVGTSTGGVDALTQLVKGLPAGFAASLFVVCHFPPGARSALPEILSRSGPVLATHAVDGETFVPGHLYVAPPDRHLILEPDGRVRLTRDARENHHRPAADPLFRSAARHYGPRVIGVVLSGGLSDGTAGLMAIRAAGGVAVVQDPRDATVAAMPQSAHDIAGADHVVSVANLAPLLIDLIRQPVTLDPRTQAMDPIERMQDVVNRTFSAQERNERRGEVAPYTCPDCGGSLWQVDETGVIQFRCHVGHAYNGDLLLAEQGEALEAALWTAVRTFRERGVLSRQLAAQERARGNPESAGRFDETATQAERYAGLIVDHVLTGNGPNGPSGQKQPA